MAMVVKNNMSAVRTLNTLNSNTSALQKSLQKVSSGMKINSAQDDASGYAISERMRVRIRSLDQANQNAQNDSSLMKTAEGAVGNTVEILRALKEKAINAANDSNTDEDRQTIQKEINQFIDQIDDNALVQFNGKYLVDGSKNNATQSTKTILLNQSLQTGTKAASALTELNNRAGDSLGIQTTDKYQVSWVQNGTVYFTSGNVEDYTIKDILTLQGKGTKIETDPTTGDETEVEVTDAQISQISATAEHGLISGAAEEPETPYNEPFTVAKADAANLASSSDEGVQALFQAYQDYVTNNSITETNFTKLDDIVDTDGNKLFAAGTDGAGFGDDTGIIKDGSGKYILSTDTGANPLNEELEIYNFNPKYTNTTDEIFTTPSYTTKNETASAEDTYDNALNKYLVDNGHLNITTPTPENTLSTPASKSDTASVDLKDIKATDADGNVIKDSDGNEVAKYYIKDGSGKFVAADFTVTRTKNFTDTGTGSGTGVVAFTNESIAITDANGDPVADNVEIYEYNPNYAGEETEETGLDDAADKFGKAVYTPDKTDGIAFGAMTAGVDNQISGLTISILDQDGNVKKAANAALDQFKQYQRAENKTGDMSLNFHIGSEANVAFKVGMGDMRSQALGLKGSDGTRIDVFTKEHANAAINVIENALTKALDQQTTIGAIEARLEYTSTNLTTSSENVQAAESTIRDADMAKEMTNYTKSNVLLQAAQAMLAQANQNSSAVLSLLQ